MRRLGVRTLALALAWACASCSEKTEVLRVETAPAPNQPPTIVAQGPTWSTAPIDLNVQAPPYPYVIAADPNGASDIALCTFTIEAAIIRRIVVRPDSVLPDPQCNYITWSDSVNISSLLPSPIASSVENCSMYREGSMFTYQGFGQGYLPYPCFAFPNFATQSPYFGLPIKPCGPSALSRFGVYPPGVPFAFDANLTFVDLEYVGLRATVYDGAGQTASATFPNVRIVYRAYGEKASPP